MITETLDGLLQAIVDQLDFVGTSIITAPGDSLSCDDCNNPILAGTIGPIKRVIKNLDEPVTRPPENARRRSVELVISLSQCVPRESSSITDIGGTDIIDRIEQTDQAIECALKNGFTSFQTDGNDLTITGWIADMIPLDADACQVTQWTVFVSQCLEECE